MKVMMLVNNDLGLYKFRKELVKQLCKENEVYTAVPSGEFIPSLEELGCHCITFDFNRRGMNPIADLKQMFRYIALLKEIKPDIVLTYTIKPNVYGGLACQILGIPYIANITGLGTAIENGGLLSFISTNLYRLGLRKAGCVFFQNESNKDLFVGRKIVKGKNRLLPGSGVNLEENAFEPYPTDEKNIRFLFVGRIIKNKGVEEFITAIRTIHKENINVTMDVVGGSDEDYSRDLETAEAEGAIRCHGLQPAVSDFYKNCHCTVLPSYYEGTANVLLESSATGRPVITTRVPGCMETFDEGVTGFGCEARSAESLTDAMRKFLSIPHAQRAEMGKAARAKIEREYDRNIVIRAYLEEIDAAIFQNKK